MVSQGPSAVPAPVARARRRPRARPVAANLRFFTGRLDLPEWIPLGWEFDCAVESHRQLGWEVHLAFQDGWVMCLHASAASPTDTYTPPAVGILSKGWAYGHGRMVRSMSFSWCSVPDEVMPFSWWMMGQWSGGAMERYTPLSG